MSDIIRRQSLDAASLILLACALIAIAYSPMLNHPAPLTIALPEYIPSALEPDVELNDQGRASPQFEAWAIQKLRYKQCWNLGVLRK